MPSISKQVNSKATALVLRFVFGCISFEISSSICMVLMYATINTGTMHMSYFCMNTNVSECCNVCMHCSPAASPSV